MLLVVDLWLPFFKISTQLLVIKMIALKEKLSCTSKVKIAITICLVKCQKIVLAQWKSDFVGHCSILHLRKHTWPVFGSG